MAKKQLEIEENMTFQRREWAVQRLGWWLLGAFVLAALIGVFGKGPASYAEAGNQSDPFWIEYERFVRVGSPSRIVLHRNAAANGTESVDVRVSRAYYDSFRIDAIYPEPEETDIGPELVTLRFQALRAPHSIILDVEPLRVGRHTGSIAIDGAALQISHFAYF